MTLVNEDIQKLLTYLDYAEPYERAMIQVYNRMTAQESKARGFPDDPRTFFDFQRQVRQAAVWTVTDDFSLEKLTGRLPTITELHARVAAKVLNLAGIPHHLDVTPIELAELSEEELFRALGMTLPAFLEKVSAESLAHVARTFPGGIDCPKER